LLWSKNAQASEWVSQEIGTAHGSQKPILPFVLEQGLALPGCEHGGLSRGFWAQSGTYSRFVSPAIGL